MTRAVLLALLCALLCVVGAAADFRFSAVPVRGGQLYVMRSDGAPVDAATEPAVQPGEDGQKLAEASETDASTQSLPDWALKQLAAMDFLERLSAVSAARNAAWGDDVEAARKRFLKALCRERHQAAEKAAEEQQSDGSTMTRRRHRHHHEEEEAERAASASSASSEAPFSVEATRPMLLRAPDGSVITVFDVVVTSGDGVVQADDPSPPRPWWSWQRADGDRPRPKTCGLVMLFLGAMAASAAVCCLCARRVRTRRGGGGGPCLCATAAPVAAPAVAGTRGCPCAASDDSSSSSSDDEESCCAPRPAPHPPAAAAPEAQPLLAASERDDTDGGSTQNPAYSAAVLPGRVLVHSYVPPAHVDGSTVSYR